MTRNPSVISIIDICGDSFTLHWVGKILTYAAGKASKVNSGVSPMRTFNKEQIGKITNVLEILGFKTQLSESFTEEGEFYLLVKW